MSDQVPLQFLALQPHEFDSLPAGFEYEHEISEASNTTAFDTGSITETFDVVRYAARGGRRTTSKGSTGTCYRTNRRGIVGLLEDERLCSFFR
jgi:hypothetical protein